MSSSLATVSSTAMASVTASNKSKGTKPQHQLTSAVHKADNTGSGKTQQTGSTSLKNQQNQQKGSVKLGESKGVTQSSAPSVSRLKLFDHLPKKLNPQNFHPQLMIESDRNLHSATVKLGELFRTGAIIDDDDRAVSLLGAFCNIIEDYKTPPNKSLSWDLDKHIKQQVQHIVDSRQLSIGMGNLIKYLRHAISHMPLEYSEAEAKSSLMDLLRSFLEERVVLARESIAGLFVSMIKENDVVLTFGSSPLVRQILLATAAVRRFRLIVVDTRPLSEGLATLTALSPYIRCVYVPLSGAAATMREATRVLLGASALLSNGAMLAPSGSAMVAALAKARHVPVIVASESYKFSERVQLDSIVFNELGSATEVVTHASKSGGETSFESSCSSATVTPQMTAKYRGAQESPSPSISDANAAALMPQLPFQVINLRYDLTPMRNISVVATETGLIPPTSIPVLIRELRSDMNEQ